MSHRMQLSRRAALRLPYPMPLATDSLSPARPAAVRSPGEGMSSQRRRQTAQPVWTALAPMGELLPAGRVMRPKPRMAQYPDNMWQAP